MKLQFYSPRWGSENVAWDDFFSKVKTSGYDGVEFGIGNFDLKQKDTSAINN